MVSATAVGVMNGTRAETKVDIVGSETELFSGIDSGLIETELLFWLGLNFVERDADDAKWCRKIGKKFAGGLQNILIGVKSSLADMRTM